MQLELLCTFVLVGGTALSLKYGHRKSIDLDLFSNVDFNNRQLKEELAKIFTRSFESTSSNAAPGVFSYIDDIKVDFVKYHYHKEIRPIEVVEGIRLISSEDIAAMKIFAIMQRAKKKDFYDLSLLLDVFGAERVIGFYFEKFPENMTLISIPQAMLFFDEAESDEDPVSLKGQTWKSVKKNIQQHINNYLK
ncbi:nucleotidyl transferase AbiEii/AbiGii toxin family protein [Niabella sp.]|uniref:nucleotidyl transferase AbiEii/AbiGii toxin family protein n=1 Tax=Niabella sp. TaxID=1962976 RepID=UPI00261B0472|nr:nucleotidyl transferase AbiEii/AbiGii toxin family protein [Niabella sp.]